MLWSKIKSAFKREKSYRCFECADLRYELALLTEKKNRAEEKLKGRTEEIDNAIRKRLSHLANPADEHHRSGPRAPLKEYKFVPPGGMTEAEFWALSPHERHQEIQKEHNARLLELGWLP